MTEQRKSLIKLISAVIIILLLPVLFFRFIGDDPTKKAVNSTRQIAVVNEDTGVLSDEVKSDEEDKSAQFGKEVATVLGERPNYSWTVVNRSAAETGLASKKYDAIVYIPSDFSKNILSYDKDHPQKATLEFSIQDNLNAVNKEKVQRELEDAQKTMNKKMSALYWNFVSQKVDNIRGEFDKIVNKESEFQNVMYNFYKPSSNDLAGEIKQQKDLIDELKKSMNEAQGTTKEKASTAEEAKNTLKDFIDTVERYKEYQENQKKLLLAAQDSTQQQIQTGLDAITAQQKANQFSERMSGLATGISQAKTQLGLASLAVDNAKKSRQDQVPLQEMGMKKIENDMFSAFLSRYKSQYQAIKYHNLNQLQQNIEKLRLSLFKPKEGGEKEDEEDTSDNKDNTDKEDIEDIKLDLEKQRDELKNVATEINDISEGLKEPEQENPTTPAGEEPSTDDSSNTEEPSNDNSTSDDQPTKEDTGSAEESTQDNGSQNDVQTNIETGQEHQESSNNAPEQDTNTENAGVSKTDFSLIKLADETDGSSQNDRPQGDGADGETDISDAKKRLNEAAIKLKEIENVLHEKQEEHNNKLEKHIDGLNQEIKDLNTTVSKLNDQIVDLTKKLVDFDINVNNAYGLIYDLEDEIIQALQSRGYVDQKEKLTSIFSSRIQTDNISNLMKYYNSLNLYKSTLNDNLDLGSMTIISGEVIQEQDGNVKSVLALTPAESASWEDLKNNTMQTDEDINSFIDGMTKFTEDYSGFIRDTQAGVLDELTKISESAAKATEQLVTGTTQEAATFSNDGLSGTMALSVQDTVGQEVLQMSDMMGSLSDRQSGIIDYTTNMQQSVNDVQVKADTLNNNWGKNVASTKLVRNDVYGILGNTLVDGQNNGYVYDYLANPLKISGEVPEEKIQTVPPVVILVIVLISSLLIGYFSSYYQNAPLLVKGALFGILNILVGLMISLFGLNIYSLPDDQTIKWSVFTILLLVASSAFIRTAFRFGSIPGWAASAAMILFYVAPLIDLIMPNFTFEDPVSKVYIDIQYGTGHLFTMGITVLLIITVIAAALPLIIRMMAEHTAESDETYEV
ncbi:type VII secretion protein EsaA [Bacillus spizizenii]|uniref:type VII secretion protein EsaA n=1 Tax=Bacillus spizizenii TaxID=96241 RepID=UPI0005EF6265|nr:type VII secretion protein EsaA [Bacillus spizizenii]MDU7575484.1 type VII secretion protein EsaA [Bacillus subtilis]MCY7810911.1 type VII secretion protein EsaA [Bacillus spizizenii]MCY7879703.1 type VII secretion protein EsaA [Bacillus spizizenii]MCY7889757.1 type VII secretion protein EsaA [Bacillus spizizenii]MCY7934642.1 type VII secretion protein EsaA [Bacillus spizizenii]